MKAKTSMSKAPLTMTLALAAMVLLTGCSSNSFFDPSKTGRFVATPTTVPILDRIACGARRSEPRFELG